MGHLQRGQAAEHWRRVGVRAWYTYPRRVMELLDPLSNLGWVRMILLMFTPRSSPPDAALTTPVFDSFPNTNDDLREFVCVGPGFDSDDAGETVSDWHDAPGATVPRMAFAACLSLCNPVTMPLRRCAPGAGSSLMPSPPPLLTTHR